MSETLLCLATYLAIGLIASVIYEAFEPPPEHDPMVLHSMELFFVGAFWPLLVFVAFPAWCLLAFIRITGAALRRRFVK